MRFDACLRTIVDYLWPMFIARLRVRKSRWKYLAVLNAFDFMFAKSFCQE